MMGELKILLGVILEFDNVSIGYRGENWSTKNNGQMPGFHGLFGLCKGLSFLEVFVILLCLSHGNSGLM